MKPPALHPLRYVALMLACAAVLVARSPNQFFAPKFVLEDGKIFFAQAYDRSPSDTIFATYAGYWHLAPRLIAEVGTWLPLNAAPLFFAVCALLISSVALSWFYLPNFRSVVQRDSLRLAFVLLLVLLPGLDGPVLIAYSQWYLALWGALLIIMTPPRSAWLQWTMAIIYLVALASAPVLFVLWPLWVWRLIKAPNRSQRAWMALIVVATAAMAVLTLLVRTRPPAAPLDLALLATDVTRGIVFRVFTTPLLGYSLGAELVRTLGWLPVYGLAAVMAAALALMALAPALRNKRDTYISLVYIGVCTAAVYVEPSPIYQYPFANKPTEVPLDSIRYFFLAIVAVYLLTLIVLDRAIALRKLTAGTMWVGMLILLLLYSPTFALPRWPDPDWSRYVHLLENIIDPSARGFVTQPTQDPPSTGKASSSDGQEPLHLRIPISPEGWNMVLDLPAGNPQGYVFAEGPRLLGISSQVAGDELQIDVFWQTPGALDYTAYVHLLDGEGQRMTGTDVALGPQAAVHKPDEVWTTQHSMALPATLSNGSYDIAIGLYLLQQDQLIPGSAVIMRDQVQIGQPAP